MTHYIAQVGPKVALVEAVSPLGAEQKAGKALRLPTIGFGRNATVVWPAEATVREATTAEVEAWTAAQSQVKELRGLSRKRLREHATTKEST